MFKISETLQCRIDLPLSWPENKLPSDKPHRSSNLKLKILGYNFPIYLQDGFTNGKSCHEDRLDLD